MHSESFLATATIKLPNSSSLKAKSPRYYHYPNPGVLVLSPAKCLVFIMNGDLSRIPVDNS